MGSIPHKNFSRKQATMARLSVLIRTAASFLLSTIHSKGVLHNENLDRQTLLSLQQVSMVYERRLQAVRIVL